MNQAFSSETSNANNPSTLYIDYYTNRRYCENLTKDGIINKQKKDLIKLATEVGILEKEVSDLKKKLAVSDHCEKELIKANEKIEALSKEKDQILKDSREEKKKLRLSQYHKYYPYSSHNVNSKNPCFFIFFSEKGAV